MVKLLSQEGGGEIAPGCGGRTNDVRGGGGKKKP